MPVEYKGNKNCGQATIIKKKPISIATTAFAIKRMAFLYNGVLISLKNCLMKDMSPLSQLERNPPFVIILKDLLVSFVGPWFTEGFS